MTAHDFARSSSVDSRPRPADAGPRTVGEAVIRLEKVAKRFTKRRQVVEALTDVDISVEPGEFVALIGPSGCGKSTVLNMVAGLMRPSAGTVEYRGAPITSVNTEAGYMTQHDSLIPWRTVEKNIAVPLEIRNVPAKERRRRTGRWLEIVGLDTFATLYPNELSGGMRQRVAIARTLIYEPELLLMDEPFGALDAQTRLRLQEEFLRIWRDTRPTVLFVTHDLTEALALSDRIVVFSPGPGTVAASLDVPFERPRQIIEVQEHPDWAGLHRRLWDVLSGEED